MKSYILVILIILVFGPIGCSTTDNQNIADDSTNISIVDSTTTTIITTSSTILSTTTTFNKDQIKGKEISFDECVERMRLLFDDESIIGFAGVIGDNKGLFVTDVVVVDLEYPRINMSRETLYKNSKKILETENNIRWGLEGYSEKSDNLYGTFFKRVNLTRHSVANIDNSSLFGDVSLEYEESFPDISSYYPEKVEFFEVSPNENQNMRRGQIRFNTDDVVRITKCVVYR